MASLKFSIAAAKLALLRSSIRSNELLWSSLTTLGIVEVAVEELSYRELTTHTGAAVVDSFFDIQDFSNSHEERFFKLVESKPADNLYLDLSRRALLRGYLEADWSEIFIPGLLIPTYADLSRLKATADYFGSIASQLAVGRQTVHCVIKSSRGQDIAFFYLEIINFRSNGHRTTRYELKFASAYGASVSVAKSQDIHEVFQVFENLDPKMLRRLKRDLS